MFVRAQWQCMSKAGPGETLTRDPDERGDWVVEKHENTFGEVLKHGLDDGVIFMVLPKLHGWRPMEKGMMLSHQTYAKHVTEWIEENEYPRKVAVVNVKTGEWQTVWETDQKWRLSAVGSEV